MTASVTPEPAATTVDGVEPRTSTPEAPPPRSRAGMILLSAACSLVALVFGVIQLIGLFGPGVVESSSVAAQIQSRAGTGVAVCSEDLPAEVGASITCSVLGGGDVASVRATVTAVDGDTVSYDLEQVG